MLKLTFYNLSVQLESDDYILLAHINSFLQKHYTKHEQKGFSQNQAGGDKLFGSKIKDRPIYMFHANQFIHLYHHLDKLGYKLIPDEKIDKRDYKIIEADMKVRDGWELRDYQIPIVDFLLDNPTKSKLVPIQTGKGKAAPLDSRIKIPGGWSLMRDMKVGSIITAWDGTPTKVTGVYPQGSTPVYKLTFYDGRSTECSDEHLWEILNTNNGNKTWEVVNTLQLIKFLKNKRKNIYIKLIKSEQIDEINLPVDPYLLGCLIGDGQLKYGRIIFTNTNNEMINNIKKVLPEDCILSDRTKHHYAIINKDKKSGLNTLTNKLREIDAYDKVAHEKIIPDIYLRSSHSQRLRLLQGLMDTDGTANNGSVQFFTTSYILAKQVQYLIRSIGGIATIYKRPTNKNPNWKDCYIVNIRYNKPSDLFTFSKKKNNTNVNRKNYDLMKLRLESIEYIGEKETQCISIDHPDHLYITDDFIVTHNTFTALATIAKTRQRLGVIILPTFIDKWILDIVNIHETKTSDIMVIQGSKALSGLIQLAKSESIDNNYFIFSTRTLQDFISQYEENPELCIDMYGCSPIELFPLLGIGIALIDESHMHYHAIFKIIIYTNVKFQIGLSATLMSDDSLVARMHKVVYPNKCIYEGGELDRYADVYAISYTIPEQFIRQIKTKNYGSNNYSHTAFEQSIIRNNDLLRRYIKLIKANIDDYYIEDYQDQDKVIIFVSTVALATRLTDAFRSFYPEFKVKRYCEEDSYEEMLGGDIIVSTPISAGTALDIPRLRVAVQTVSISSAPTNIQILGRLRKLTDRDVKFCYIYANNINKQREYHHKRVELFRPRVANIAIRQSSCGL